MATAETGIDALFAQAKPKRPSKWHLNYHVADQTCEHCKVVFRPKRTDRLRFCSRECSFEQKRAGSVLWRDNAPRSTIHVLICSDCRSDFVARRKVARCRPCAAKGLIREPVTRRLRSTCYECSTPFYQMTKDGRPTVYCSPVCRDASDHRRKSIARRMWKAKVRGVTVERVDPLQVFDRDKWRCQLCGCKTPKALRGTIRARAPELDHIVPLSLGGEHSYRNTQCACRSCNGAKGGKALGQMRLVG